MLTLFGSVLTQVTLPIIIVTGLGYALQKRLSIDVPSLNRLIVYAVLPCFLFHYLSSATIPLAQAGVTAWFTVLQFFGLMVIGWAVARITRMPPSAQAVVGLAAAFANSGNYGIPLVQLAFGPKYLLDQAVIVSLHSILITSVGTLIISHQQGSGWSTALRSAFRTPIIPAVLFGVLFHVFSIRVPVVAAVPIEILGNAYTPLALFALGAQLAISSRALWSTSADQLGLAVGLRLLAAPVLTWGAVLLFGIPRGLGDMLIVSASAPVGVLLAIVCAQYRVREELAAGSVFISTMLSPLFVTGAIIATRLR